jgi:hypothetical protein
MYAKPSQRGAALTEFDDPTQHDHDDEDDSEDEPVGTDDQDEDEESEIEGQTGGLYGGAEDFEREDPDAG